MVLSQEELARRASWSRPCDVCGTHFGWAKNGDMARFCSRRCAGKSVGATRVGRPKAGLKPYECSWCKTPFLSYYKARTYCGMQCTALSRRENQPVGYAHRVDNNQAEVVNALRAVGASVLVCSTLGGGFPDLIVGYAGHTALMEIKNPKTQYGRAGLSRLQKEWHTNWRGGTLAVVDGVEAALRVLAVMRNG